VRWALAFARSVSLFSAPHENKDAYCNDQECGTANGSTYRSHAPVERPLLLVLWADDGVEKIVVSANDVDEVGMRLNNVGEGEAIIDGVAVDCVVVLVVLVVAATDEVIIPISATCGLISVYGIYTSSRPEHLRSNTSYR